MQPDRRRLVGLAALLYLAGSLFALRVVLPAPASLLPEMPMPSKFWRALSDGDQYYSVAMVTFDARTLLRAPGRLMDGLHCWPMPHATTLGEHMIGAGLLGIVPDRLFGEPILTYNVVLTLLPWIAGLAMFALVAGLTGSAAAALVAGACFAFHPARLGNVAEPYWMGNQWAPLALLFAHRLFTRGRWLDGVGLAVFTGLQLVDSFYPIVAFALVGAPFLVGLAWTHRKAWRSAAPKLLVATGFVVAIAAAVFVPYLETRAGWHGLLSGRELVLYAPSELSFGGQLYPGTVATLLAAVGVLLWRREAATSYARPALLVGGLLVLWAVLRDVPVIAFRVPSLLVLAKPYVPGLDAVRIGTAIASGFFLAVAVLAGFGAAALLAVVPARIRPVLVGLLVVGVSVESLQPALARAAFGRTITFAARHERPPDDVRALYAKLPDGPVLDLPADVFVGARYVFASAYHGRPTVGCYGSFPSPLTPEIAALAGRLESDPEAARALAALGIRSIVAPTQSRPRHFAPGAGIRLIGGTRTVTAYALDAIDDARAPRLVAGASDGAPITAVAGAPAVTVPFSNPDAHPWVHPPPIEPRTLRAEWQHEGRSLGEQPVAGLLPIVLPPGGATTRAIGVPVPTTPGFYRLSLRSEDGSVIADDMAVQVVPGPS